MFNVKISRKEYQVDFDHIRGNTALFYCKHEGTCCLISVENREINVARGYTVLHSNDNYDKNFGRKLSLARALKNGRFSKPERVLFWEAYFKTRGKIN